MDEYEIVLFSLHFASTNRTSLRDVAQLEDAPK